MNGERKEIEPIHDDETIYNEEKENPRIDVEPIQEIIDLRKKQQDNVRKQQELKTLKAEREELELQANIRKEKLKIEQLKIELEKPEPILQNKQVLQNKHVQQPIKHNAPEQHLEEVKYFGGRPARFCKQHNQWEWIDK